MRKCYALMLLGLFFLAASCTLPVMGPPPNPGNPYYKVAILPFYNATNDVDGPKAVRTAVYDRIKNLHYSLSPSDEVDQALRDRMGITLGSQLDMTSPQKLGEELGVDAVLYGYVLNFETVTSGVYNVKKVRAGFRLVDARSGRTVWAGGLGVKTEMTSGGLAGTGVAAVRSVQDNREGIEPFKAIKGVSEVQGITNWHLLSRTEEKSVGDAALLSLGEKIVSKSFGVHLKQETDALIRMVFAGFPVGPGIRGAGAPEHASKAVPVPAFAPAPPPAPAIPAYLEFGRRDFSADLIMTSFKDKSILFISSGKLARRGPNFRSDIDISNAIKEASPEARMFSRMAFIEIAAEKRVYTLYPELKKYMDAELVKPRGKEVRIDRERLGEETIDGHRCVRYRITITPEDGKPYGGLIWEAKNLDNFVIKAEFEEQGVKSVIELRNVKFVTPPAVLFQVPKGFDRASNMMELMMGKEQ